MAQTTIQRIRSLEKAVTRLRTNNAARHARYKDALRAVRDDIRTLFVMHKLAEDSASEQSLQDDPDSKSD